MRPELGRTLPRFLAFGTGSRTMRRTVFQILPYRIRFGISFFRHYFAFAFRFHVWRAENNCGASVPLAAMDIAQDQYVFGV